MIEELGGRSGKPLPKKIGPKRDTRDDELEGEDEPVPADDPPKPDANGPWGRDVKE